MVGSTVEEKVAERQYEEKFTTSRTRTPVSAGRSRRPMRILVAARVAMSVPRPAMVSALLAASRTAVRRPRSRQYAHILTLPASWPGGPVRAPGTRDHHRTGH